MRLLLGGREEEILREYKPGREIVVQGEEGHEMFVLVQGQVSVTRDLDGQSVELALLGPGESFGEMGLLEGLPRSATVTARTAVKLRIIQKGTLVLRFRREPEFAVKMMHRLAVRVRDTSTKLARVLAAAPLDDVAASKEREQDERD